MDLYLAPGCVLNEFTDLCVISFILICSEMFSLSEAAS